MTPEEIQKQKEELLSAINEQATKATNDVIKTQLDELENKLKEDINKAVTAEEVEELKKSLNSEIQKLQAEVKKMGQTTAKKEEMTSIHEAIGMALSDNAEMLKGFKGKEEIAIKGITNASFATGALGRQTTDVRQNLYQSPYSPFYLRNIFPNVSTNSASIVIPQVQAITGTVDIWARGTGTEGADVEKPEVTPSYKDVQVDVKWIAGITHVNRELLLNVNYLQNSIPNTLLYSRAGLFARENKMITDYIASNAIAYNGGKTVAIEKVVDACFVQLLGSYYNPTHVLMNPADYTTYIKFNKALGSGEYDQPNDMLKGFSNEGFETNVRIIPVPSLTAGVAYAIASNEFEFINRLTPELAVSEHHDQNFTFNKVTFRVEEMAGFIAKDLNAMIKITL